MLSNSSSRPRFTPYLSPVPPGSEAGIEAKSGAHAEDPNQVVRPHPPAPKEAGQVGVGRARTVSRAPTPDKLAHLRQLIAGVEKRGFKPGTTTLSLASAKWQTGAPEIDQALPQGQLSQMCVHEVTAASHGEMPTASAYLAALVSQLCQAARASPSFNSPRANAHAPAEALPRRQVLWCQTKTMAHEFGLLHGAGLQTFGLNPEDIMFVHAGKTTDVLWALEEGARAGTLLAVVGEVEALSFTHSRRLTLAATAGNTPVLVLRPHHDQTASAAETRWRLSATPGAPDPFVPNAPGNPRWQVALTRCRGGKTGRWDVEWNHETHRLGLVEHVRQRLPQTLDPPPDKQRGRRPIRAMLKSLCTGS